MKKLDIRALRKEYTANTLKKIHLQADPFDQLKSWLREAVDLGVVEANAMTLATANKSGKPSSRTVLLKEIDDTGLLFYTNYGSRKSRDLEENPFASVTFYWKEMERQATVEGSVEKVSEEHSAAYFALRPRPSQLGAWCSQQDAPINSREELEKTYIEYEKKFTGIDIPKPPFWGGFRILPCTFTFWQGRENRLHDRFLYTLNAGSWEITRLSP